MTGPLAVLDSIDPMGMTPEQAQQKLNQVWMERQLDTMQDQVDDFLMETGTPEGWEPVDPSKLLPLQYGDWEKEARVMMEPISVVPTPFPTLNDICRRGGGRLGWRLGWHIILGGAPGYGKTTVALNCAVHAALKGKRVGIVSLEMSKDELMSIMLSVATHTSEKDLEAIPGVLNTRFLDRARIFQDMLKENGGGIYLVDMPRSDLKTVDRTTRQMMDEGCELLVTDYVQRVGVAGKTDDYGKISEVSSFLQGMAKQNRVVSLALSQFNRATTTSSYTPKGQGLSGSSALENDASQILIIDHSRYHRNPDGTGADFVIGIGKNRHGPLVDLNMHFNYADYSITERTVR